MLPIQLSHLGLADKTSLVSRFVECFKTMWASNGNLVSRTYTGTGAMEGGARVRILVLGYYNRVVSAWVAATFHSLLADGGRGNLRGKFKGGNSVCYILYGDVIWTA